MRFLRKYPALMEIEANWNIVLVNAERKFGRHLAL